MPSYDKKLTEPQALVLYVIWLAKRRDRGKTAPESDATLGMAEGLTNVQIQTALHTEYTRRKRSKGDSLGNVKKIIDILSGWKPSPLLIAAAREGNEATVYRLAKDMVKWSTTATMLLQLETEGNNGPVTETSFVQQMVRRQLRNPDGTLFTKDQIEKAFDFCENMPCPYVTRAQRNDFIGTTDRVDSERRFLVLMAQNL